MVARQYGAEYMTDTTLGISNRTWAIIELTSAGLLAAVTARGTYAAAKSAGGLGKYLRPNKDSWKSAAVYSNLLISILLIKGAIDAAKEYDIISGTRAGGMNGHQLLNGYGQQNYF